MAFAYDNLPTPKNTASGVADSVLIAPEEWFDVNGIKCPVAPFANPGDEVVISTQHEFIAGKGFFKIGLAPEKNKYEAKTIGDKGSQQFAHETEVFIPGSYAEQHEMMKNLLNVKIIALIKDSNCGADFYYQMGCDCVFASFTADFSTGTTKDGVKGYLGKISYNGPAVQIFKVAGGPTMLP